ncbi:MAG: hypothetical protein K0S74_1703 [Chlamydiales bacterium]|nr:hypothetical protein [Chlamydiales bacterium]
MSKVENKLKKEKVMTTTITMTDTACQNLYAYQEHNGLKGASKIKPIKKPVSLPSITMSGSTLDQDRTAKKVNKCKCIIL